MTIKDIAKTAGVSVTTVSMVLNNKDNTISEETRKKVLRVASEYNFKTYAKALQNQSSTTRSGLVGLMVPEGTGCFSAYMAGAEEVAGAEGYSVIFCATEHNDETVCKQLNNLQSKNVDGIALYLTHDADMSRLPIGESSKAAFLIISDRQFYQKCADLYCSYGAATQMAAEHLLSYGHKQIALLGLGQAAYAFEDVVQGYRDALYQHDIAFWDDLVCQCDTMQGMAECVRKMLNGKATAFLCAEDSIAICVYRELGRFGLQIPKDYSVVSLSAEQESADMFFPALSLVDMPYRMLGRHTMQALIAAMEGTTKEKVEQQTIMPQLLAKESVAPPMLQKGKRIVVVGSMNMDIIIHAAHIPTSGESLIAQKIITLPGGKGANQAVGAAKLGGDIYAIGCLGGDQDGRLLYSSLDGSGVNMVGVHTLHDKPTGKAYILVAQDGESTIVVSHGTNRLLNPAMIDENKSCFESAAFCLLSTEIPWQTVEHVINLCVQNNIKIILKPTLQTRIPPEVLKKVTFLIPNEKELAIQVDGPLSLEEKVFQLYDCGVKNVIATLGDKGCYLHNEDTKRFFHAADFTAVDTTGAADAFISAFAVYLSEGHSIISAIKFATYAAGISVTRDGVQPALADRTALEMYSDKYSSH